MTKDPRRRGEKVSGETVWRGWIAFPADRENWLRERVKTLSEPRKTAGDWVEANVEMTEGQLDALGAWWGSRCVWGLEPVAEGGVK